MANYGAWRVTYTEGQWVVLSGPSSMVVMEPAPATASELLDEVWGAVLGAESITALAATLTSFGLDRMPAMAVLFHTERGLKALLRGPVELRDGDTGELVASGVDAATWHEVAAGTPRVFLHLDEVDPNAMLQLPLVVGAARASAVLVDAAAPVAVGSAQFAASSADGELASGTVAPEIITPAAVSPVVPEVPVVIPVPVAEPELPSAPALGAEAAVDVALYDEPVPAETPEPADEEDREVPGDEVPDEPVDLSAEQTPVFSEDPFEGSAASLTEESPAEPVVEFIPEPVAEFVPEPVAEVVPEPQAPAWTPEVVAEPELTDVPQTQADSLPAEEAEDWLAEPSWLRTDQPDPDAPILVALHEPQFDDEEVRPVAPVEPTQVLDGRPPWAPGQDPEAPDFSGAQAFGTRFGDPVTGTTGPFGAEGFGALISSAAPSPAPFVPAEPAAAPPPVEVEPVVSARAPIPAPAPKVLDPTSDHDGATVFATGIAATHKPAAEPVPQTTVMASVCALGHPNRPGSRTCRVCGGIVDAHNSQLVNRPVLGAVTTQLGDRVLLVAPVIVGRAPSRPDGDAEAELLRVPSPGHDISRSHVRISSRDWAIEVTDLHSTNGTVVTTADGQSFRLAAGQTVSVAIGDRIDLGDGQILTIAAP